MKALSLMRGNGEDGARIHLYPGNRGVWYATMILPRVDPSEPRAFCCERRVFRTKDDREKFLHNIVANGFSIIRDE